MSTDLPIAWNELPSRRALLDRIDQLSISADAKLLLADLLTATIDIGGRLIEAGRRILAFILEMARQFPGTVFGVALSMLIASIPLLGGLLGPLLAPLLIAFGLGSGALSDLKDGALRQRVAALEAEFRAITA